MALAGHQHGLAGAGQGHRQPDGLPAVRDHQVARLAPLGQGRGEPRQAAVLQAGLDFPDNGQGVFGAGIVAGDDDQMGARRGGLTHEGPLNPIPVAAAAEHGDQPGKIESLKGRQGLGDGHRGVGVIHEHAGALRGAEALQPARHAGQGGDAPGYGLQVDPQTQGGGAGRQDIGQIEGPHQLGGDLYHAGGGDETGLQTVLAEAVAQGPNQAVGMAAIGEHRARHGVFEQKPPRVVQVEDRQAPGGAAVGQDFQKEPGFGGKIFVQVPVIIQVVLRKVGEHSGGEGGAVHPS